MIDNIYQKREGIFFDDIVKKGPAVKVETADPNKKRGPKLLLVSFRFFNLSAQLIFTIFC